MTQINSKSFFDQHFTNEFRQKDGNAQTVFFCKIALDNFPKWLTEELNKGLTIADIGCAMGECVDILQKKFKNSKVVGIDFSSVAIKEAQINFPNNSFYTEGLINLSKNYDLIFSSNTLEHFYDPINKLKKLLKFVNRYLVLLVPFQEYERTDPHFYTFDYQNFPLIIGDFSLPIQKSYQLGT